MFELVKDFRFTATAKYGLHHEALGGLVCEKTRQIIAAEYPDLAETWVPKSFKAGSLKILATNASAANALFIQTQHLLSKLAKLELPVTIEQIKIVKR